MNTDKISPNSLEAGGVIQRPEIVEKILELSKLGWGKKRIARELGTTPKTVRRYLRLKEWQPYQSAKRAKQLDRLGPWLEENFYCHKGNAVVVQQELLREHQITLHIRTVERAVKLFRQKLMIEAKATVRFETPPGKQMQIDFGSMTIKIGGEARKIYFFVATLGFSRRPYVQAFSHERQSAWFAGMEGSFCHFGGVPQQLLLDNPKPLVTSHNPLTREVIFNERLHTFSRYWNFQPKACAPYRARTKGKDESGVKYVKRNAIAGREFVSWEALSQHLDWWMREIADQRIHGTTGEKPLDRFLREEVAALQPLNGRPPFCQIRELSRVVHTDACIEVETNFYSVPWHLIKERVTVQIADEEIRIFYQSKEISRHPVCMGNRVRVINPKHLQGIVGANWLQKQEGKSGPDMPKIIQAEFFRPLSEYESIAGGSWL
jgi:transposase